MLTHFRLRLCVLLLQPTGAEPLVGYYQNVFVTAVSEESARSIVSDQIRDGEIDWSDSEIEEIDLSEFDPEISSSCADRSAIGVWYCSGRIFFPAEEEHKGSG